jgi:serine/threonine-protein kinase RIO1
MGTRLADVYGSGSSGKCAAKTMANATVVGRTGNVIVTYRVVGVVEENRRRLRIRRRLFRPPRAVRRWTEANGQDFIVGAVGREAVRARLKVKDAE